MLVFASKENDLQSRCKERASEQRKQGKNMDTEPPPKKDMGNIGILGLGDGDYAINASIFNHFARQPKFIKTGATEWRSKHSEPQACEAVEPSSAIFRQCSSFCVETAQRQLVGLQPETMKKCQAVLLHANRHMRDLYASVKKQISGNVRHPLFFARVTHSDGAFEWRAWLFTRAVFKPRAIDGVAVYPSLLDTEALQLSTPFVVSLDIEKVEKSDHSVPRFLCMDEIMVEMATLQLVFPESQLEYCYNPAYDQSFSRPLTELRITGPLNWAPVDSVRPDYGSDDDDQPGYQDDESELDEIDDMVSSLVSIGAQGADQAPKKPRPRTTKKGSAGSAGGHCLSCSFMS
jgi:hypothetical protein